MQSQVRACNDELEIERFNRVRQEVRKELNSKDNGIDATYYDVLKKVGGVPKGPAEITQDWPEKLSRMIPKKAFEWINIKDYANIMDQTLTKEEIATETYMCAMFLPETQTKQLVEMQVGVKHPDLPGVDILSKNIPNVKHLSVNTTVVAQKNVKKVKEIRYFNKASSVWKDWKDDDPKLLDTCFETDHVQMKVRRFLKDESDYKDTMNVIKKYYSMLKEDFLAHISNVKSYPVIHWLNFIDTTNSWGIIDKNLTLAHVDRIFITVNFEEEEVEANDDTSFCRFEYIEAIVRLAKAKYFDQKVKICTKISASLEKFIQEYVLPNRA